MLLKRRYDPSGALSGIEIVHAGHRQRFSPRLVEGAIREGWMIVEGSTITLRTDPPTSYRIVRGPGYYCCYCGLPQPGSQEAQAHVAVHRETASPTVPSWWRRLLGEKSLPAIPDPANPSGYRKDNFYECERVGDLTDG